MAQIIDGYCSFDNVTAEEIARHNISMYGSGDYVLPVDECLGYELISNNEIQIKDGLFITQGRRGYIKKGTTEACTIENGAQDVNRNDIIVIEYAKDEVTLLESHTLKIIKGTAAAEAVDPEIVTGDIGAGDVLHQMPLYRVRIEGLSVVAVEQMFEIGSVAAETVDPMEATEEGFAADAALTGAAIGELNKNLKAENGQTFQFSYDEETGKYGYIVTDSEGADTFSPFIDTSDATAAAEHITEGYTAYVNGELIVGTRPSPNVTYDASYSGISCAAESSVTVTVYFEQEFETAPTVSNVTTNNPQRITVGTISDITTTYFKVKLTSSSSAAYNGTIIVYYTVSGKLKE